MKDGTSKPIITDQWGGGKNYEAYVGRWSRLVAPTFLNWLNIPTQAYWLDVGCGTGAISQTILEQAQPAHVQGIDPSEGFITYARSHILDRRTKFEVASAHQLPVDTAHYDAVVSGLALNFIPDKTQAASEMLRVVKPDGVVAAYVWDYAGKMQFMRSFWDAAVALDPEAEKYDEGKRFSICQPQPLKSLFETAGLKHVEVRSIDIPTRFQTFEDYWTPFLGGQGSAPSYVAALDEHHREALRHRLHTHLPIQSDGSISLTARVWAVKGSR